MLRTAFGRAWNGVLLALIQAPAPLNGLMAGCGDSAGLLAALTAGRRAFAGAPAAWTAECGASAGEAAGLMSVAAMVCMERHCQYHALMRLHLEDFPAHSRYWAS
jgi:hypothetical protein